MKFMDVVTKKEYQSKDQEVKTKWFKVGTIKITDDGKMFLELNIFPNTNFYVFEQKPKEEAKEGLPF